MKKLALIAALLCAVSSGVYAASDVTLYGVVDGAVSVSKAKGKAARVGFDNSIWAGSRFGIKGNEDLGSGYNLGFILEQGFKTFSGDAMNSSKAFARQSALSVSTPFGTFAAGRTGGLSSDCGTYNILHGSSLWTSYYSTGNIYGTFILSDRMDNVLLYNTPDMNGSTIHFMYSNDMGDNGDEQKWSKDNHYYGVGYEYAKGPALFSAMWEMYDHKEQNLKSSRPNFRATTASARSKKVLVTTACTRLLRPMNIRSAREHCSTPSPVTARARKLLPLSRNSTAGRSVQV